MGREEAVPDEEALLAAARPKPDPVTEVIFGNLRRMLFSSTEGPKTVGQYVLRSPLGEGAMGTVFEAFDPVLDRSVALKLLKRRDAAAQASLLDEARALAKLAHDNVVRVYDAGSWNEQVYIVMELVDGVDLGHWLRRHDRAWEAIVPTFAAAAEGLAVAHDAGLVHGDFKPSNVLVSKTRVCVADFGMAHGTDREEASTPTLAVGGTPLYMAPERLVGGPPSALSDQFAFFVSLFEALLCRAPFRGRTAAALFEAMGHDLDAEPDDAPLPRWLRLALARGLHRDPEQRYPSMRAVAALLARPRAAIRRRRVVGAAALVTVGIGAAVAGRLSHSSNAPACEGAQDSLATVWSDTRRSQLEIAFASSELPFAADSWTRAAAHLDRFGDAWVGARTDACRATRIEGVASVELMDRRMACLDRRLAETDALLRSLAAARREAITDAVRLTSTLANLDECRDTEALLRATPPPDAPEQRELIADLDSRLVLAFARFRVGQRDDVRAELDAMQDAVRELAYPPVSKRYHDLRGRLLLQLGEHTAGQSELEQAYREAVLDGDFRTASRVAGRLALDHRTSGDAEQAPSWMQTGADMVRGVSDDGETRASHWQQRARLLGIEGEFKAAEQLSRQADDVFAALNASHPERISVLSALGGNLREQGRNGEAVRALDQAYTLSLETYGKTHPDTVNAAFELASALAYARRFEAALRTFDDAFALAKAIPLDRGRLAMFQGGRCMALLGLGKFAEAEAASQAGLELWQEVHGADHFASATYLTNLASAQEQQDRPKDALRSSREARRILRLSFPPEHPRVVNTTALIAKQLHALGDTAATVKELDPLERGGQLGSLIPVHEAWARLTLADALMTQSAWSPEQQARALRLGVRARDHLRTLGPTVKTELAAAEQWVDEQQR